MPYLNSEKVPAALRKEDRPHEFTSKEEFDDNFELNGQEIRLLEGEGRDVSLEPFLVSEGSSLLCGLESKIVAGSRGEGKDGEGKEGGKEESW